jgi:hypothetical protein
MRMSSKPHAERTFEQLSKRELLAAGLTQPTDHSAAVFGPQVAGQQDVVSNELLDILVADHVQATSSSPASAVPEGESASVTRIRFDTDIDKSGKTTPLDALIVINDINLKDSGPVGPDRPYDPNQDGNEDAADVVTIINDLHEEPVERYLVHVNTGGDTFNGPLSIEAGDIARGIVFALYNEDGTLFDNSSPGIGEMTFRINGDWSGVDSIVRCNKGVAVDKKMPVKGPTITMPIHGSNPSFEFRAVTDPNAPQGSSFNIELIGARTVSGQKVELSTNSALAPWHPNSGGVITLTENNPDNNPTVDCNGNTCSITTSTRLLLKNIAMTATNLPAGQGMYGASFNGVTDPDGRYVASPDPVTPDALKVIWTDKMWVPLGGQTIAPGETTLIVCIPHDSSSVGPPDSGIVKGFDSFEFRDPANQSPYSSVGYNL